MQKKWKIRSRDTWDNFKNSAFYDGYMSLQDKVECLSEVFGIENMGKISASEFYCVPLDYARNISNVRVLLERKLRELNGPDSKKVALNKREVLKALEAESASWVECTFGGLPLRIPIGNLSQVLGTTHQVEVSPAVAIEPHTPEELEKHKQAFEERIAEVGKDKYIRFKHYTPHSTGCGKINVEVKNGNGDYSVHGNVEKTFHSLHFRSMGVSYRCIIAPERLQVTKGQVKELRIAIDISEKSAGSNRYWTRFYIVGDSAEVKVAKTSLSPYIHFERDKPEWKTSPTISKKEDAINYVGKAKALIDILNSFPIDEKRLDQAVTDAKSSVDGKKGWFGLW